MLPSQINALYAYIKEQGFNPTDFIQFSSYPDSSLIDIPTENSSKKNRKYCFQYRENKDFFFYVKYHQAINQELYYDLIYHPNSQGNAMQLENQPFATTIKVHFDAWIKVVKKEVAALNELTSMFGNAQSAEAQSLIIKSESKEFIDEEKELFVKRLLLLKEESKNKNYTEKVRNEFNIFIDASITEIKKEETTKEKIYWFLIFYTAGKAFDGVLDTEMATNFFHAVLSVFTQILHLSQ